MKRKYTDLLLPLPFLQTRQILKLLLPAFIVFVCCLGQAVKAQDVFALNPSLVAAEARRATTLQNYDLQSAASNNYDVHFYRCRWTVDPAVRAIKGSVGMHFTATASANEIVLDLSSSLLVDSILFRNSKIAFNRNAPNSLAINLPVTLTAGQKDSVEIFYGGVPSPGNGYFEQMANFGGTPILWTLSEPYGARTWWPCKDNLRDKADSIDIYITCPQAYTSSSNGLPVSDVVAAGQRTVYWKHRYPIVAYLVAIAVTDYVVDSRTVNAGGKQMPLVMYSKAASKDLFANATTTAAFCLERFSALLSNYPFDNERYAQTQFPHGGGMEHQTNSFIGSADAFLVAHELGHQWFGDKVTCGTWGDIWLNEGFATYTELLHVELSNPANRINTLINWRNRAIQAPGGSIFVTDTANINRLFDSRLTYIKGGYVVHMLRTRLGDTTFFRGVRRYLADPALAYKTATTADLRRNLEAESGQQLQEFFTDWVYGEGYPTYQLEWAKSTGNAVNIRLQQTTSHPSVNLFEGPLPVRLSGASVDTTVILNFAANGAVFTINPTFEVTSIVVNPNLDVLTGNNTVTQISVITSNPSIPGAAAFNVYPVPAKNYVHVTLPAAARGQVFMYNTQGQVVYQSLVTVASNRLRINTSTFAAGMYWLHWRKADGSIEKKEVLIVK